MQTASDPSSSQQAFQPARKKSIFGNFRPEAGSTECNEPEAPSREVAQPTPALALARCFLYRFFARVFEYPDRSGWEWMCAAETEQALENSLHIINQKPLETIGVNLLELVLESLHPDFYEEFLDSYIAAFGHAARGSCPLNEIEYGELKADPLFQPHRLADIAAFYRANGLELTPDATERQDHICMELEFMSVLAAKEAYASRSDDLADCRETEKQFLRQHLARWTPAFFRRVMRYSANSPLGIFAELAHAFLANECARFSLIPGSHDLVLREIDEAAESLCGGCGLHANLPGAKA